jgi:ketosteroid isomerase-like protein
MKTQILLLFCAILIAGCAEQKTKPGLDPETVNVELKAFQDAHREAIDAKDIEGITQFYSPDLITVEPGMPIQYGNQYFLPTLTELFTNFDFHEDFVLNDIRIMGDRVAATYQFNQQMTPLAGGETIRQSGKGICILKRIDTGKWQFEWNAYGYDTIAEGNE